MSNDSRTYERTGCIDALAGLHTFVTDITNKNTGVTVSGAGISADKTQASEKSQTAASKALSLKTK